MRRRFSFASANCADWPGSLKTPQWPAAIPASLRSLPILSLRIDLFSQKQLRDK